MIILIVIIIIVAIFFLIIKKVINLDDLQENNKIEDQKNIENEIETYKKYYKPRIYITTLLNCRKNNFHLGVCFTSKVLGPSAFNLSNASFEVNPCLKLLFL